MAEKKTETKAKKAAPKAKASAPAAATETKVDANQGLHRRKIAVGTVVSDKMQKTIVVQIDRRVRHTLYKKYVTKTRRFKAHDEMNEAKMGDLVEIVESRPLSRDKRWALRKVVRKAIQTAEANV